MKQPTKKQMTEWMKNQEEKAKSFKLKARDIHNLYDLFYMTNWMDYKTVKLNAMEKWFENFFERLDDFCITETAEETQNES